MQLKAQAALKAPLLLAACLVLGACVGGGKAGFPVASASAGESFISASTMGWERASGSKDWTFEALEAVAEKDALLSERVPADIAQWCPGYEAAPIAQRRMFWVGMLHAVARHESTWNPTAVGGGGRYFGLMQISPRTASHHGCEADTGAELRDGGDNLVCAVEIFSKQVASDGLVAGAGNRGIGRDWGPFRKEDKRAQMAAWSTAQPWCKAG